MTDNPLNSSTSAFILSAGTGSRFIGDKPKQLLKIKGDTVIGRLWKQLIEKGIAPWVVTHDPSIRKEFLNIIGPMSADTILHTVKSVLKTVPFEKDRFVFVLGDTVYDDAFLDKILKDERPIGFWLNGSEIYGLTFSKDRLPRIIEACDQVIEEMPGHGASGNIRLWHLYRKLNGLDIHQHKVIENEMTGPIVTDGAMDIDTLQGYQDAVKKYGDVPPDADIIIPVTTANKITWMISTVAVRTCRASTKYRMLVLNNNSPNHCYRDWMEKECELLGIRYEYVDGPFSISKFFNLGIKMTTGKYIALGCADVIYYQNWLENIIELWEEQPDWFAMCNYTFDRDPGHPCAKTNPIPERRVAATHNPSSGVLVLKRSNNYRFDEENFPNWEMDADFTIYMEVNKLKAGVCLNSRCDHLICGIRDHIDYAKHYGVKDGNREFFVIPKENLRKKWGHKYRC